MNKECAEILASAIRDSARTIAESVGWLTEAIESSLVNGDAESILADVARSIRYAADHIGTPCTEMGAIEAVAKELCDNLPKLQYIADAISDASQSFRDISCALEKP